MCANFPRSRPCAAAGPLMARSAVGGASVTAASASARPPIQGSSTVHAAIATTGSALHMMGQLAMTAATVTVGCVSVMKAGLEMPASSRRSVTYPARRAKRFAKTQREWCAPTEALATVGAACVTIRTTGVW